MRKWWREKDYLTIIPETVLRKDLSLQDAVEMISHTVFTERSVIPKL